VAVIDYHAQYSERFLRALAHTRHRQGAKLSTLIRRHLPDAQSVLDFGAGRGFFLEAARVAGFRKLIGVDSSALAVELLRQRGFEAQLSTEESGVPASSTRADVLTLLDVIEHFPSLRLLARLRWLIVEFRPRLVVVKVPVTQGLLYRIADRLGRLGLPSLIEQLYQVGTYPPHFSYFSRESAELLLANSGLRVVGRAPDRDFDVTGFAERVRLLAKLGPLGTALGAALGFALQTLSTQLSLEDSQTLFAVPLTSSD
jgi:hypothetical protein